MCRRSCGSRLTEDSPATGPVRLKETMASEVITVPSFATSVDGVEHFFGTRSSDFLVTPGRASAPWSRHRDRAATVLLSVKQVHGTDALVVDQPVG